MDTRRPPQRVPGTGTPGRSGPARAGGAAPGATGRAGEALAAEHLQRLGYRILARNVRGPGGEIDLIAHDGRVIAFVEVKCTRGRSARAGEPLERLSIAQRRRLRALAAAWLRDRSAPQPFARELRFDAIGVRLDCEGRLLALDHLEAAW